MCKSLYLFSFANGLNVLSKITGAGIRVTRDIYLSTPDSISPAYISLPASDNK